jgi:hypothetical protein
MWFKASRSLRFGNPIYLLKLLGQGIGLQQGLYQYTTTQKTEKTDTYLCFKRDSNLLSQSSSARTLSMHWTALPL